jgi:hypothetical protein
MPDNGHRLVPPVQLVLLGLRQHYLVLLVKHFDFTFLIGNLISVFKSIADRPSNDSVLQLVSQQVDGAVATEYV